MKKGSLYKYNVIFLLAILIGFAGCNEEILEFGYDGQISGKVVDSSGNIVSGDIKTASYAVNAKGELDNVPMFMRIMGNGTFANTKLYPQSYEVWLEGPIVGGKTQPIIIDLTDNRIVVQDFSVTPLLTIQPPSISGSPSSTEIKVNYSVSGNSGNTANLIEIYCSTIAWPTRTTGTGYNFHTRTTTVTANTGIATVSNLKPGTKYFIRVGARASGQTLFNHSEQIIITTP